MKLLLLPLLLTLSCGPINNFCEKQYGKDCSGKEKEEASNNEEVIEQSTEPNQIGPQGPTGAQGPQGPVGPAGPQGPSVIATVIIVVANRDITPWDTNNLTLIPKNGIITVPTTFTISALSGTTGSGWIDFRVGDDVYCFQRTVGTKTFVFSYKKTIGATSGCDLVSDQDNSIAVSFSTRVLAGQSVQVVPREPKMAGIGNILFTFNYLKEE